MDKLAFRCIRQRQNLLQLKLSAIMFTSYYDTYLVILIRYGVMLVTLDWYRDH